MSEYPERERLVEGGDIDSHPSGFYPFSVDVMITLSKDETSLNHYPGGEARAYFDFDDGAWYWSDFSGGPWLTPLRWRYIK